MLASIQIVCILKLILTMTKIVTIRTIRATDNNIDNHNNNLDLDGYSNVSRTL